MLQRLKISKQTIRIGNQKIQLLPREDRATLLICIGIALVFWLLVKLSREYTAWKTVIFDFTVPEGKTFAVRPPERLDVQVEGSGWELMFDYLLHPRIEVAFDLRQATPTELTREDLSNRLEKILSFNSIRIVENSYKPINLELEEGLRKTIPVRVRHRLSFQPGYVLQDSVQVKPDSVVISGPSSLLNNINEWSTEKLILKNLQSKVTQTLALRSPPPEVTLHSPAVQVMVPVEQLTEKSLFIPVQVRNAPDSVRYFPRQVKVTCIVGLSQYNTIDTSDFTIEIDLRRAPLREGKHTLPIQITRQPPQALSVQFTPKSAEFYIFKQ